MLFCVCEKSGAEFSWFCMLHTDDQHLRKRRIVEASGTKSAPVDNEVPSLLKYCSVYLVPFTFHLAFMVATAFFVMHVQVMASYLPILIFQLSGFLALVYETTACETAYSQRCKCVQSVS